jgi:hypothetical protein
MPEGYEPDLEGRQHTRGEINGVVILLDADEADETVALLHRWFDHRPEVEIIDYGDIETSETLDYIILEWEYFPIDELFLTILDQNDPIDNEHFFTYLRRA